MTYRIGIDVGGTFTDFLLVRGDGSIAGEKITSTPSDFAAGVLDGLDQLAASEQLDSPAFLGRVDLIVHGTTAVTNALLTRRGASTGLLTTRGFRDALEMRRGVKERIYDNKDPAPSPLVPRELRLPVSERALFDGTIELPVSPQDVSESVEALREAGVEAVAICFLHSYANDANEQACQELLERALAGVFVTTSAGLLPKIGFYDRLSTTVVNAFAGPLLAGYLGRLAVRLADGGFHGTLLMMLSSGGVAEAAVAARTPAAAVGSGPAGGAIAGVRYAAVQGHGSSVTFDMGGTSLDLACVVDGGVGRVRSKDVNRLRVAMPMVDVVSVGAGGGSIARVDSGGLLHVGPESAGADPGPAAYARGGTEPTVTDANLVLGYLNPAGLLGGRVALDIEAARAAIASRIAGPMGASIEDAALAISNVVNAGMASAVREFLYERGQDPKEFALVAAGGAGPVHAAAVARDLGIPTVVVPRDSALFSAVGLLVADLKHDFVQTSFSPLESLDLPSLRALYAELIERGNKVLADEGVPEAARTFELSADLRYERQVHEIEVPITLSMLDDRSSLAAEFGRRHREAYGYKLAESAIEFVNARISAIGATPEFWFPTIDRTAGPPVSAATRGVVMPELADGAEVAVFEAADLTAGAVVQGPALIESPRLSLLVPLRSRVTVNDWGDFSLELDP